MSIAPALSHLPTIGAYAFAVYALLDAYPDLSIRELMHRSDFSMTTIRRAIKTLEKAQLVRVDHIDGKPNHYELLNGLPLLANSTTTTDTPTSSSSTTPEQTTPHDFEKSDGFSPDADRADGVCPDIPAPYICINTDPDSKNVVSTIPESDSSKVNGKGGVGGNTRPRNLHFDALAILYPGKGQGGWIGKVLGWLREVEPEVTAEQLTAFVADWKRRDKHAANYTDKVKIQKIFGKFVSGPAAANDRSPTFEERYERDPRFPHQERYVSRTLAASLKRSMEKEQAENGKH